MTVLTIHQAKRLCAAQWDSQNDADPEIDFADKEFEQTLAQAKGGTIFARHMS